MRSDADGAEHPMMDGTQMRGLCADVEDRSDLSDRTDGPREEAAVVGGARPVGGAQGGGRSSLQSGTHLLAVISEDVRTAVVTGGTQQA